MKTKIILFRTLGKRALRALTLATNVGIIATWVWSTRAIFQAPALEVGYWLYLAELAFLDHNRIIIRDIEHSLEEERFFCIGQVDEAIITVRFTYRQEKIRIFGAGYWRKGKKLYEKQNNLHR